MENENLIPEEEEVEILTLTDENGEDIDFEYLDCLEYEGKEYLILLPVDEEDSQIVILEIEPVDEEHEKRSNSKQPPAPPGRGLGVVSDKFGASTGAALPYGGETRLFWGNALIFGGFWNIISINL